MATSDWTEGGLRVVVEFVNGMIILTAQSQAVLKTGETFGRGTWVLCQLGIPAATPRSEAARLVRRWLASYDETAFNEDGLKMFREVFGALPEQVAPEGKSIAPGNVN